MKVGIGTNNKKNEQINSKSVSKYNQLHHKLGKDIKKKILVGDIKKSETKNKIKNILASSVISVSSPAKTNKSTPATAKNVNMNLNEENLGKQILIQEIFNSPKSNEQKNIIPMDINNNYNSTNNVTKKCTPININYNSNILPKNAHVNLWRKLGSSTGIQTVTTSQQMFHECRRHSLKQRNIQLNNFVIKTNCNINSNNTNITNGTNSNILSTQFTDTKRDEKEYNVEIVPKIITATPNIDTPKNKDNLKFNTNLNRISEGSKSPNIIQPVEDITTKNENFGTDAISDYIPSYVPKNIRDNENVQSEILSSIDQIKSLLKSSKNSSKIKRIFKSEENVSKINELYLKLNKCGLDIHRNYSKNLINEINKTNQETLIDNTKFNPNSEKHENKYTDINVINADMLDDCVSKPENKSNIKQEEDALNISNKVTHNKMNVINEIYANSDIRIKRYEILFDFINVNMREINQLMNNSSLIKSKILNSPIRLSKEIHKIEEMDSEMLSSLHSKINFNSRTIENIDQDNFVGEGPNIENNNATINTNGILNDQSRFHLTLDLFTEDVFKELIHNHHNKKHSQYEPSPSFLMSSFHSEFYRNYFEDSFLTKNANHPTFLNFSYELNSHKTPNNQTRIIDKVSNITPLKLITKTETKNRKKINTDIIFNNLNIIKNNKLLSHRVKSTVYFNNSPDEERQRQGNDSDTIAYIEGEENLDESDFDKTKEQLNTISPKILTYNQVVKEKEKVKAYKNTRTIFEGINYQETINEMKLSKSPEEKTNCQIY